MKFNSSLRMIFIITILISCEPDNTSDETEEIPGVENIEIPDPNFKYALINTNCVDTNGDNIGDIDLDSNNDGEIQKIEAEFVQSIILQFNYDEIKRSVDLKGIENFINLEYLDVTQGASGYSENPNSEQISYDFTNLSNLKHLKINYLKTDFIKKIDLAGLDNLVEANLSENRASYFSTPDEWENPKDFMEINFEGCSSLIKLTMRNSFLNIDLCQIPYLKTLDMSYLEGGEPDVFDFHCLTKLEWLDISENYIETLILKNSSVLNTLLIYDIGNERDANYPFLENICLDDNEEEFKQIVNITDENTVVTTECSF